MTKREPKMIIPTRTPRAKGGMFDNLRKPEEVESIPFEEFVTAVPEHRTTEVPESPQPSDFKEPEPVFTEVPQYRSTAVPESKYYKKANEAADHLDKLLTPAESKVFEQIVRLTVGFQMDERRVRVSVLKDRTGYGSDKTVRTALQGLERKGVIARLGRPNNSGGITYRILSYSGTGVPQYRSTAAESTSVPRVEITGELKTELKEQKLDDEAAPFAGVIEAFTGAVKDLTGKAPVPSDEHRWRELAEVLIRELMIAAARTDSISNVPAFLAEHLRRRLFKKDKAQLESEEKASPAPATLKIDASQCPDCKGGLWWYPEGYGNPVARCRHERLSKGAD
jgi:hypothetical protein